MFSHSRTFGGMEFGDSLNLKEFQKYLGMMPFIHHLDVFSPHESGKPMTSPKIPKLADPYYLVQGSLGFLLDETFLSNYLKRGCFQAVSINTPPNRGNAVAVLNVLNNENFIKFCDREIPHPLGKLHLTVDKDTYEQMGIQGVAKSMERHAVAHRFDICIDLETPSFHPGSRLYERVFNCFNVRMSSPIVTLIAKWDSPNSESNAIHFPDTVICKQVNPSKRSEFLSQMMTPDWKNMTSNFDPSCHPKNNDDGDSVEDAVLKAAEWLGIATCGKLEMLQQKWVDQYALDDTRDFVSSYQCPEPCELMDGCFNIFEGFLSQDNFMNVVEHCRTEVISGHFPWLSVQALVHEDAPALLHWSENPGKRSKTTPSILSQDHPNSKMEVTDEKPLVLDSAMVGESEVGNHPAIPARNNKSKKQKRKWDAQSTTRVHHVGVLILENCVWWWVTIC